MKLISILASLMIEKDIIRGSVAVFGISLIWSIKELFEQERLVKKGWFSSNLKRKVKNR